MYDKRCTAVRWNYYFARQLQLLTSNESTIALSSPVAGSSILLGAVLGQR